MAAVELLERASLLEELTSNLAEARSGSGVMALVGGEAGIGKTSLVRRLCVDVAGTARLLVGACDAMSTPRPLGPLVDMATALGDGFAVMLGSAERRDAVFDAFLHALRSGTRPLLVVVEDVHWADDATLDLLRFLGRRVETTRALVVVTYRDDEVGPRHPLRAVVGDLATFASVRRLMLPCLTPEAVARLARDSDVDGAELHRVTGGNPFFVTEVLAESGSQLPATVRDAIAARVSRLDDPARHVLEAASVIGSQVDPAVLAATGADGPSVEACVAAGMLQSSGRTLAFRHELVRQAVYGTLSASRRRELHTAVLGALETMPTTRDDLATLAHHAADAGDAEAVLRLAPEAGRRAAELGAHREAHAQYARALPYLSDLPARERGEVLEAYASECLLVERLTECARVRRELVALWQELGEPMRHGMNLSLLAQPCVGLGDNAAAEAASTEAIEVLEPHGAGPELARALRYRAHLRMLDRDSAAAVHWGERAIAVSTAVGDVATLAEAHMTIGTALLVGGSVGAHEHLERSLELAREHGLIDTVTHVYSNLGSGAGEFHRFEEASEALERSIALAEEHDFDNARLYALAWLALTRMYQGAWSEAADLALRVIQFPQVSTISRIMALVALGRLRSRRGDPEARPLLDEALELALGTGTLQRVAAVRTARAEAASLAGDLDAVLVESNSAYEMAVRQRHPWFAGELGYWRWTAGDLAELPAFAAEPFALQVAGRARDAAAAWAARGCPYERSRALAEASTQDDLENALDGFSRLGARSAATLTTKRLRALGASGIPRGPRERTRDHPARLTPREAQVLAGLAQGLRNGEIAERQRVSPRTIDHQVSAVLAKLGVRSRTEAVAEAHRRGLVGQDGQDRHPT